MEEQGIISHADGNRPRDVLVSSVVAVEDDVYDENFPDDEKE